MIRININYRPIKMLPWERSIIAKLPIKWTELTESQFINVPGFRKNILTRDEILQIFLNLKKKEVEKIKDEQANKIVRYLQYLRSSESINLFLIKEIEGFKSPKTYLDGVHMGKFITVDFYYREYKEGKSDSIDKFLAALYFDYEGSGDPLILEYSKWFKNTDPRIKDAVVLNYEMVMLWFRDQYPYVFKYIDRVLRDPSIRNLFQVFFMTLNFQADSVIRLQKFSVHYIMLLEDIFLKKYEELGFERARDYMEIHFASPQ